MLRLNAGVGRSLCAAPPRARNIHATSSLSVKRPQKPFEAHFAAQTTNDGTTRLTIVGKRTRKELDMIETLRKGAYRTHSEKYSTSYGLRSETATKAATPFGRIVKDFRLGGQPAPPRKYGRKGRGSVEERHLKPTYSPLMAAINASEAKEGGAREQGSSERGTYTPNSRERGGRSSAPRQSGPSKGYGLRQPSQPSQPVRDVAPHQSKLFDNMEDRRLSWKPQRPTSLRNITLDAGRTDESIHLKTTTDGLSDEPDSPPARPWVPTKKLTYAAMAGVRELHAQDSEKWTREALSQQFGVSYEAINRILKSKWRDSVAKPDEKISSKWTKSPEAGDRLSPVPIIRRVYELKREVERK